MTCEWTIIKIERERTLIKVNHDRTSRPFLGNVTGCKEKGGGSTLGKYRNEYHDAL